MTNKEELYKYLGLSIAVILVVYIGVKTLKFQSKMVEGLTTQTKSSQPATTAPSNLNDFVLLENSAKELFDNIKTRNDKLNDIISIEKYRSDYENLLMVLEEYTNNMMFGKIITVSNKVQQNGVGKNLTWEILYEIDNANKLKTFVETLNSTMKYIDRKKSSSSYF